jgi:hypothetical protein
MSRSVPSQGGYGGTYFGVRSSPTNHAVAHGSCRNGGDMRDWGGARHRQGY